MTRIRYAAPLSIAAALLLSCGAPQPLTRSPITVAAAANLTNICAELGRAFTAQTGIAVVFSYGSTAALAQQLENGAPFDLFAAADAIHVDGLVKTGRVMADSRAIYALGQLAVWFPHADQSEVHELKDLLRPDVRFVAIAQPELAPYGDAAVETLRRAGIWKNVQPKLVYGGSISQAKQLASSGNADAAITAYSLVLHEHGAVIKVDAGLHKKIEQAVAIVAGTPRLKAAKQFRAFLLSKDGRAILERSGYLLP